MAGAWIKLPDGTIAHVKYAGRRLPRYCACGRFATLQCDFPVGDGKTCDAYLCRKCAMPQGQGRDYCPHHPGQGSLAL